MTHVQVARADEACEYIMPLLRPLQIGPLRLRNRFVMPGMQRAWSVDGAPSERMCECYRRRALGGSALVIAEACAIDHPSSASNRMFGLARRPNPRRLALGRKPICGPTGTAERRSPVAPRFPPRCSKEVRRATGPDFVLSVRISQWKEADYEAKIVADAAELGQLVAILRSSGADLFHVSTRRFWTPEWAGSISAWPAGPSRSPTRP